MSKLAVPDISVRFSTMQSDDNGCYFYQLRVEADHKQFLLVRRPSTEHIVVAPCCTLVVVSAANEHIKYPVTLDFNGVEPILSPSSTALTGSNYLTTTYNVTVKYEISQANRVQWKKFMKDHRDRTGASVICGYVEIIYDTMDVDNPTFPQHLLPDDISCIHQSIYQSISHVTHTHRVRLAVGFRTTKTKSRLSTGQSSLPTTSPYQSWITNHHTFNQPLNLATTVAHNMNAVVEATAITPVVSPGHHPFTSRAHQNIEPAISLYHDHPNTHSNDRPISPLIIQSSDYQQSIQSVRSRSALLQQTDQRNDYWTGLLFAHALNATDQSNSPNSNSTYTEQFVDDATNVMLNSSLNQHFHEHFDPDEQPTAKRNKRAANDLFHQLINYLPNVPSSHQDATLPDHCEQCVSMGRSIYQNELLDYQAGNVENHSPNVPSSHQDATLPNHDEQCVSMGRSIYQNEPLDYQVGNPHCQQGLTNGYPYDQAQTNNSLHRSFTQVYIPQSTQQSYEQIFLAWLESADNQMGRSATMP